MRTENDIFNKVYDDLKRDRDALYHAAQNLLDGIGTGYQAAACDKMRRVMIAPENN